MAQESETYCFEGDAWVALFAARPWIVLSMICAVPLAFEDSRALFYALGIGVLVGLGDACWTYAKLGSNRILIDKDGIRLLSGRNQVARISIESSTVVTVEAPSRGFLDYFSAAYTTFADIRVSGSKAGIEYLAKTRKQIVTLQKALDYAVEEARISRIQDSGR